MAHLMKTTTVLLTRMTPTIKMNWLPSSSVTVRKPKARWLVSMKPFVRL